MFFLSCVVKMYYALQSGLLAVVQRYWHVSGLVSDGLTWCRAMLWFVFVHWVIWQHLVYIGLVRRRAFDESLHVSAASNPDDAKIETPGVGNAVNIHTPRS